MFNMGSVPSDGSEQSGSGTSLVQFVPDGIRGSWPLPASVDVGDEIDGKAELVGALERARLRGTGVVVRLLVGRRAVSFENSERSVRKQIVCKTTESTPSNRSEKPKIIMTHIPFPSRERGA